LRPDAFSSLERPRGRMPRSAAAVLAQHECHNRIARLQGEAMVK